MIYHREEGSEELKTSRHLAPRVLEGPDRDLGLEPSPVSGDADSGAVDPHPHLTLGNR